MGLGFGPVSWVGSKAAKDATGMLLDQSGVDLDVHGCGNHLNV